MSKPRVAVVGCGVAGLSAAWMLREQCELLLFEKKDYVGGHTRTLEVPDGPDQGTAVDTGFIVMNHRNYPHFTKLLEEWEVPLEDSDMSFSYFDENTGYQYAGKGLKGLFPSAGHLVNPQHLKLLKDLYRFGQVGTVALNDGSAATMSLAEFLDRHQFGRAFRERYLYAMGAAIWSSPPDSLADFPAEPYLRFFENHGLLTHRNRPDWRVVSGGSREYLRKMLPRLGSEVQLNSPPEAIFRTSEKVELHFSDARKEIVDHVIIAAHADDVLPILGDADEEEQRLLGAWTYQPNEVVLHSWEGVMPTRKPCWASWNFSRENHYDGNAPVSVSYWMNNLQNLNCEKQYFVTLNRQGDIPESEVINRTVLNHPQYDQAAMATQKALQDRNGSRNTWLVGSYFGYGFHEDAVKSSVDMVAKLKPLLKQAQG